MKNKARMEVQVCPARPILFSDTASGDCKFTEAYCIYHIVWCPGHNLSLPSFVSFIILFVGIQIATSVLHNSAFIYKYGYSGNADVYYTLKMCGINILLTSASTPCACDIAITLLGCCLEI